MENGRHAGMHLPLGARKFIFKQTINGNCNIFWKRKREGRKERVAGNGTHAPLEVIYILMPPHVSLRAHIRRNRFSNISVICTRVIIGYAHYRLLIIASSQRTYTQQLYNNCKTVFCIVRSRRYYYRSDAFINYSTWVFYYELKVFHSTRHFCRLH